MAGGPLKRTRKIGDIKSLKARLREHRSHGQRRAARRAYRARKPCCKKLNAQGWTMLIWPITPGFGFHLYVPAPPASRLSRCSNWLEARLAQ